MLRRGVALVLIPLLLLPGMCGVHAHAGISDHDPSGKDRPPHFHLRVLASLWRQSADDPYRHPYQSTTSTGGRQTPDHDDDAIYLPVSILLGGHTGPPVDSVAPPALQAPVVAADSPSPASVRAPSQPSLVSAVSNPMCPIYLRALSLLI
jgi:hypothetical protein